MSRKIVPAVCTLSLFLSNIPASKYIVNAENRGSVDLVEAYKDEPIDEVEHVNSQESISSMDLVNIKDINLLVAINESLNKENLYSDVTLDEMLSLEYLDLSERNIEDLEGIQFAKNLKELDVSRNKVSDMKHLQNLVKIEYLDISYNSVFDISPLKSLINVKHLNVSNQIIYMDLVKVYSNEFILHNIIKNLDKELIPPSFISDNGVLEDDKINWNTISEHTSELKINFDEDIKVGEKKIGSFSGEVVQPLFVEETIKIPDKVLLEEINKSLNKKELDSIILKSEIETLESLEIDSSYLENLEGLECATNLKELTIRNTSVKNFNSVSGLKELKKLNLMNNNITDIEFLKGLTSLESLNLQENKIEDVSAISDNLYNLRELNLSYNNLYKVELGYLNSLINLDVSNNFLTDVEEFPKLSNLKTLNLNSNNISNIRSLSKMNSLSELNVENQTVYLPKINSNQRILKVKNPVINVDDSLVEPLYISKEGMYEDCYISWENLDKNLSNLEFEFNSGIKNENIQIGNFSGKVLQPLNVDLFAEQDYISLSLSTNQLEFENYTGLEDVEKLNAVQLNVDSNKAYNVSVSVPNEIKNVDGTKNLNVEVLSVKESSFSDYTRFKNINQKVLLLENMAPGVNSHLIDFKLNKNIAIEKDSYRAVAKFEVEQK